jgi:hypothetical protein
MPKASDLSPESRFVALFIGPKSSGKTVAACSFPKPLENLDFDGRIRGLLGAPWIDRTGINYDFFPPKEMGLISRIDKKLQGWQGAANAHQLSISTVVLDSLTSATFAFVCQSLTLTHTPAGKGDRQVGKYLGSIAMTGPEDYGVEAQVTYDILATLRSVPIPNVIVSAHVIDRYGKIDPKNPFSESVVIGEKLSLRDKISANVGIYFDHIFRFDRRMFGDEERYFVRFRGDLACTSYSELPEGEHDITGKNFYEFMMRFLRKDQNAHPSVG